MICTVCKNPNAPFLFTPRELGSKYPRCRACVSKQNKTSKGRGKLKHKGTEMWRSNMKRHFL